jgi:signal transduction histidine kinase
VAWNIGVLCAILLVVAAGVYFSQSHALAASVDTQLGNLAARELASGHPIEDLAELSGGANPAGTPAAASSEESGEPYEASESPNLFALVMDAKGHVAHSSQDVQMPGLPDLQAAWPVLRGRAPTTLVTLDVATAEGAAHFRLYTVPVSQHGRIIGALQVGTSLAPRYAELHQFLLLLAVMGVLGVLLAAVGGVLLAERALGPAQQAFERQRAFVADASHELRTPLSLMRAEAELLLRALERDARAAPVASGAIAATHTGANQPQLAVASRAAGVPEPVPPAEADSWTEMARDLVSEVDFMSHLVGDLLQLARMDRGREPMHWELVALDVLAERTCASAMPMAAERGLRLMFNAGWPPGPLPRSGDADGEQQKGSAGPTAEEPEGEQCDSQPPIPPVSGDPDRLRQIILVLLDNALRYTPAPGNVRLTCWHDRDTGQVVLEVADSGPGIAPEHLPRLFDRFYRVDRARSRELGGSGLGLAIADGLARAQAGTLSVESQLGVGTAFWLMLPVASYP